MIVTFQGKTKEYFDTHDLESFLNDLDEKDSEMEHKSSPPTPTRKPTTSTILTMLIKKNGRLTKKRRRPGAPGCLVVGPQRWGVCPVIWGAPPGVVLEGAPGQGSTVVRPAVTPSPYWHRSAPGRDWGKDKIFPRPGIGTGAGRRPRSRETRSRAEKRHPVEVLSMAQDRDWGRVGPGGMEIRVRAGRRHPMV
ncbi:hypothetical protein NDU88_003082 [Pleurodeles waltl]|uniref:Uncharacterized protein n=1 Tax=Pleurodeles waltl TaxID=8319 RepID=A0AAV7NFK3_PLEWA|nr:hypothetical protein NDU88_003082 [Pleurodeles waltl]